MHDLVRHLRFSVRALMGSPAFTLTVVVSLAVGTGATMAMFSATYALLIRPLPYRDPGRIVSVYEVGPAGDRRDVALASLLDWRESTSAFAATAAYRPRSFALMLPGPETERTPGVVQVGMVTTDFFAALGATIAEGRGITEQEEIEEAAVIVVGSNLASEIRSASGRVVGERVLLNDAPYDVIGVLAEGSELPMQDRVPQAYVPLGTPTYGHSRAVRTLRAIARLEPGVTIAAAREELATVAAGIAADHPDTNHDYGADLEGLHASLRGPNRGPLLALLGAAILLLLIACSNVASLALERTAARRRDTAIRTALGASTMQIAGTFLAEGAVLALAGSSFGLFVAKACLGLLPRALPVAGGISAAAETELGLLDVGPTALAAALVLAGVATSIGTLVPLWHARSLPPSAFAIRSGGATGRATTRRALVVAQIALSLLLLLGAGVLLRSLVELTSTDPGFEASRVLRFGIGIPEARYDSEPAMIDFHTRLLAELHGVPDVDAAGLVAALPLGGRSFSTAFDVVGEHFEDAERPRAAINIASPGFFEALRVPVLDGRGFTPRDDIEAPRVVLVSESFVDTWLAGVPAPGRRIRLSWFSEINPRETEWEIVGVVGDIRHRSLEQSPVPQVWISSGQFPLDGGIYVVRTRSESGAAADSSVARAAREAVVHVDPGLERVAPTPLTTTVRESVGDRRLAVTLASGLAAVAALLTAIGIYGLLAFGVQQRRTEIAVRRALGASAGQVLRLVFADGLRLSGLGVIAGLAAWPLASGVIRGRLYGVSAHDPVTIVAVASMILLVAAAASAIPSARACRTSPIESIRES